MARERKYGWNGEMPAKSLSGQAKVVFDLLREHEGEKKTGKEWAELANGKFATRQDPYRVVLYYIIIFKGQGLIVTDEFDINAVTKKEDVKHRITVKTRGSVDEGETVEEPAEEVAAE